MSQKHSRCQEQYRFSRFSNSIFNTIFSITFCKQSKMHHIREMIIHLFPTYYLNFLLDTCFESMDKLDKRRTFLKKFTSNKLNRLLNKFQEMTRSSLFIQIPHCLIPDISDMHLKIQSHRYAATVPYRKIAQLYPGHIHVKLFQKKRKVISVYTCNNQDFIP